MVNAFVGFGSNIGWREENLRVAKEKIQKFSELNLLKSSSLYFSEPVGGVNQPWFLNSAIELATTLDAEEIYEICKEVEEKLGRKETKNLGPRIIDIDLLLVGNMILDDPELKIPHPSLHKRKFVLLPLLELNNDLVHPKLDKPLAELLDQLDEEKRVVKSVKKRF